MEMGHEPKLSMLLGLAPALRAGVCKEGQHQALGEAVEKQELLLPSPLLDGNKCPHSTSVQHLLHPAFCHACFMAEPCFWGLLNESVAVQTNVSAL